jgi:hypothetical protein
MIIIKAMNFIYEYGRDTTFFTLHVGKIQTTAKYQFTQSERRQH